MQPFRWRATSSKLEARGKWEGARIQGAVREGFLKEEAHAQVKARTKPDPRGPGSWRQQNALTVWCKHRLSEAPAFFLWRDPTRCKQMAAEFLNMRLRAVGP